jgi:predicted nucleotidyltransferase
MEQMNKNNITCIGYEDYKEFIYVFRDLTSEKLGNSLLSLVLYGSVARSEAKKESDIDLLVIFLDMIENSIILLDKEEFFKRRLGELKNRLAVLGSKKVFLKDGSWYWDLKPDLVAGETFEL